MTDNARPLDAADEPFLDRVFERAVERIEAGTNPITEELLEGREHLRVEVEALLRTARKAALVATDVLPQVRGFVLETEIGRGGMGTVYLARQETLGGRRVALKVLPSGALLSPRARERFVREARAIAHLRHPNIVTVHDVVADEEVCAYAMEWVEGASLSELIDFLKTRTESAADGPALSDVRELLGPSAGADGVAYPVFVCRIAVAIARALGELHRAGLVHRDVKPSNVLLRADGTALLSDFGLVHSADATLTHSGQFVGTVAYASPEQLGGDPESLDARSDVYALGVTLYQALTLHLPFDRRGSGDLGRPHNVSTAAGMLRLIESGRAAPLRAWNRRLPRDLETIVAKAMDPERSRRYASADELADDVERMLGFQPIRARPASALTRGLKLLRRNRKAALGIAGGSLASLVLAALVVVYVFQVPDWVRAHVRDARLILLDPAQANGIFVSELWGLNVGPALANSLWPRVGDPALEEALAQYDAALRWSPLDAEIRAERGVVLALLRPSEESSQPVPDEHDLRAAGLAAYLRGDVAAALRNWEEFERQEDPTSAPDPLVEAGLGILYLVREEAARAYPRLRDACQALPDVAFLTAYLADAALCCGDLDAAEQLLLAADGMPHPDPRTLLRVRADLLAARGRDAEAEACYRRVAVYATPATLHYARFLVARGRREEAVYWYVFVAENLYGPRVQREYVSALEDWWAGLSREQRLEQVRSTLEVQPTKQDWLVERLRVYLAATRLTGDAPARTAPASSRPLEEQPLSDLAATLEVENRTRWKEIRRTPRAFRHLQFWAWRSPWPHELSAAIERLASRSPRSTAVVDASAPPAVAREAAPQSSPSVPCFQRLGDLPGGVNNSVARCLSADGTTVGGGSGSTTMRPPGRREWGEPFRWRADTGMVGLGGLLGDLSAGEVLGLSADGEVAVGWSTSANGTNATYDDREAFRWTASGGMVGLGDVEGGDFESVAAAISGDGRVIAGYVTDGNCYRRAAIWTASGGWSVQDRRSSDLVDSVFEALSNDGRWAAGMRDEPCHSENTDACRWSAESGFARLGLSYGALGLAVSDLGEVAGQLGIDDDAFVTAPDGQVTILEDLPGGADNAKAQAILPVGDLVVGWGTSPTACEAVLWDESRRIHRVVDVLASAGVVVPAGWLLSECAGVARNGGVVTLCGTARNANGEAEAWIARYEDSRSEVSRSR